MFIIQNGHSPTMEEIAGALGVRRTRAKTLVHQLAVREMIKRVPGAQRGISIPGLIRDMVIEELRRDGYVVNKDVYTGYPCPQGHLPLIAILEHVPSIVAGEQHDHSEQGGAADL